MVAPAERRYLKFRGSRWPQESNEYRRHSSSSQAPMLTQVLEPSSQCSFFQMGVQ